MHDGEKRNLVESLERFASQVTIEKKLPEFSTMGFSWFTSAGVHSLSRIDANAFSEFISRYVKKPHWSARLSERYIIKQFRQLLKIAHTSGSAALLSALDELIGELEGPPRLIHVLVPVIGVELKEAEGLLLGGVEFIPGERDLLMNWISTRFESIEADHVAKSFDVLGGNFEERLLACSGEDAEPIRAEELALEKVRRALELITFGWEARRIGDPRVLRIASARGDYAQRDRHFLWHISESGISASNQPVEAPDPIPLDKHLIEFLDDKRLLDIAEVTAGTGDISEQLKDAIHWFSVAKRQPERENQLLNLMTCFEVLLSQDESGSISETIALHLAILIGNNYKNRRSIYQRMKTLYNQRSDITHNARVGVTEWDIAELRYYATELILTLLKWKDAINDRKDLRNQLSYWVKENQLGADNAEYIPAKYPRTLAQLMQEHSVTTEELVARLLLQSRVDQSDERAITSFKFLTTNLIDYWIRNGNQGDLGQLVKFGNALEVKLDRFLLPNEYRLIDCSGYEFLLIAKREEPGHWIAKTHGYKWSEAKQWLVRLIDPADDRSSNPFYVSQTPRWVQGSTTRSGALDALSSQISEDLHRALMVRQADDPADWIPLPKPEYWGR